MKELNRIRWQCRRGLLELDLVLAAFLDRNLETLDQGQLDAFRDLLQHPDNDLLDLVMGRTDPVDPRSRPVLAMLRHA